MTAQAVTGKQKDGRWRLLGDPAVRSLIAASAAIGVAGAFVVPTTSLFLTEAVAATPLMVGLFFAARSIAEIGTDMAVGAVSDRLRDRRTILVLTALLNAAGALCYTFLRDYYALLVTGMVFFGLGGACFGQLFAYTRELADSRGVDAPFFNGFLRSVTSLAWVVGPPLAFWVIAEWSFTALYAATAGLSLLAAVLCRWGLPRPDKPAADGTTASPASAADEEPSGLRGMFAGVGLPTLLVLGSVVLLLGANAMYQINLPLYVTDELDMSGQFAGLLLGVSAALEIPLLVLAGVWADRLGKRRLMIAAAVCATLFFALLPLAESRPFLLALQPLNSAWAAIALNIPVVMLQDSLPGRPGTASALYSSAFKAGMFLGGLAVGTVATWTGYAQVFWVCAGLTALAGLLVLLLRPAAAGHPTDSPGSVDPTDPTAPSHPSDPREGSAA
ncbi:sugar efflux transporter [Streptomyces poonensis]|uniref:Sugar efflux transporter SetB n=1 Tax=Streptomyces poonensis TaxID=68255 RepID=A0A918UNT4_9ACTN|nr:sugar efflux transporter [Streptomyces poonensis]GGZ24953.1 sugar efflux transporter SetB [Streptomyces poonensis]GLJ93586.1 sugar efflux transporter A [Streptomyces poonensis]